MAEQRLLYIDATQLSAYRWSRGALRAEGEFTGDGPGAEAFSEYLREHADSLFTLVADVAEEGFQSESIPFVQGSDRTAMIRRKLSQYYYGTPLSVAVPQGREKTGRRDEKLLFVALTRPQTIDVWLTALRQHGSQVTGLYTLPLAIAELIDKQVASLSQCLLITQTRAGLRQTFFENGQLRFSRLATVAGGEDGSAVAAAESAKIYQYLTSQRLIARGTLLPTLIFAHPADLGRFRERCRDSDEMRFAYLDLPGKAKHLGLKSLPANSHCEGLLLHLVATKPPRWQLLPPADRRSYRVWQTRVGLNRAAALIVLASLLFATKQMYDVGVTKQNTVALLAQTAADRQRYDAIMQTLPPIPQGADNVRAAVNRFDELDARSPQLDSAWMAISKALQDDSRIEVSRIDWQVATTAADTAPGITRTGGVPLAGGPAAIAEFHGTLPVSMANDHRGILDAINGFANKLRSDPAVQVRILSMPFDLESGKTLKSDGDAATSVSAPRFSLRIVRRLGAE